MKRKSLLYLLFTGTFLWSGCNTNPRVNDTHSETDVTETSNKSDQDEYIVINDTTSFRSKDMEHDEFNGDYYYYSQQTVDIMWPKKLSGCKDITPLHQALIENAFGKADKNAPIEACLKRFLGSASFLKYLENAESVIISNQDVEGGMNCYADGISLHPFMKSPTLMTFVIGSYNYAGGAHGFYTDVYVNFDKKSCNTFDESNTFMTGTKQQVVAVINQFIKQKQEYYDTTSDIPTFYFGPECMTFVFSPYAIACYAEGIVKIDIPYAALEAYFTDSIKQILKGAKQFRFMNEETEE